MSCDLVNDAQTSLIAFHSTTINMPMKARKPARLWLLFSS